MLGASIIGLCSPNFDIGRQSNKLWELCLKNGPGKNVLYLPSRVAAPDHKYIRSSPIGWTKNCHSDISLTPSLNQSSNKCQIWPFSTQSNLRRSEFEAKQNIWNLKGALRALHWSLSFPNLILDSENCGSKLPPPLKNGPENWFNHQ